MIPDADPMESIAIRVCCLAPNGIIMADRHHREAEAIAILARLVMESLKMKKPENIMERVCLKSTHLYRIQCMVKSTRLVVQIKLSIMMELGKGHIAQPLMDIIYMSIGMNCKSNFLE